MSLRSVSTTSLANVRGAGKVRAHVAHWIRNPDRGSNFDRQTRLFRWLPVRFVIAILFAAGYEGLVFFDESDSIVGHVFFQRRGDSLHAFHWYIQPDERGRGHMHEISNAFFEHARSINTVAKIRIGAGGNERIARLWESIRDGKIIPSCGLMAGEEMGWLYFPERCTARTA